MTDPRRMNCLKLLSLVLILATAPVSPAGAAAVKPVSEIVIDAQGGKIAYAAEARLERPPASLTKMMTLLLTFEAIDAGILQSGSQITMTRRGARQPPSRLGLAQGRTIGLQTAMRAVAVISANDLAVALAERIAGSEAKFVVLMNKRAARLGMTSTRFGNVTGLSPSAGWTTAQDMATLARYLVRNYPARYRIFSARSLRWNGAVRPNHNRLLGKVPGVDGVKTGYTVPAGFNLAASSVRHGKRVIVVVLGARTAAARDLLVANLLESGFSSSPKVPEGMSRARRRRS